MLETASRAASLLLTGENWIDMAHMIRAQRTFYTSDGPDERRREEELGDEPHALSTWTEKAPRDGSAFTCTKALESFWHSRICRSSSACMWERGDLVSSGATRVLRLQMQRTKEQRPLLGLTLLNLLMENHQNPQDDPQSKRDSGRFCVHLSPAAAPAVWKAGC